MTIGNSTGLRVLLFEDPEENIFAAIGPYFESMGLEVQHANTVAACLEVVRVQPPAVVVMITNNIHERPAFEVAESIRKLHPTCGFVFLGGSERVRPEPFWAAGYDFIVREIPLPLPELCSLIRNAADHPEKTFVIPQKSPDIESQ